MKHDRDTSSGSWVKLILPATLGLIAAFCYWTALSSRLEPHYFVKMKVAKKAGEKIAEGDLVMGAYWGDAGDLGTAVMTWDQVSLAPGSRAVTGLRAGQFLLKNNIDIEQQVEREPNEQSVLVELPPSVKVDSGIEAGMEVDFVVFRDEYSHRMGPKRVLRVVMAAADSTEDSVFGRIHQLEIGYIPYEDGSMDEELNEINYHLGKSTSGEVGNAPNWRLDSVLKHRQLEEAT